MGFSLFLLVTHQELVRTLSILTGMIRISVKIPNLKSSLQSILSIRVSNYRFVSVPDPRLPLNRRASKETLVLSGVADPYFLLRIRIL
jgi:hypothetical protein